jgi:hypothetical protein
LFTTNVLSTSAAPSVVLGDPGGWFAACALAGWPTTDAGPGGLEKRSRSEGALESPARVVAVCTLKSMCESEGVVAFQDHRLHVGEVPFGQLLG